MYPGEKRKMPGHVSACVKFLSVSHRCQIQFVTSLRLSTAAIHILVLPELSHLPSSILSLLFSLNKHCRPAASCPALCLYHHKVTKLTVYHSCVTPPLAADPFS